MDEKVMLEKLRSVRYRLEIVLKPELFKELLEIEMYLTGKTKTQPSALSAEVIQRAIERHKKTYERKPSSGVAPEVIAKVIERRKKVYEKRPK